MINKTFDYLIGIDPGVKTGFAVYNRLTKEFITLKTGSIIEIMSLINNFKSSGYDFKIYFEDARQRKWFGSKGREALQGAGSIKRDCKIWQEFCEFYNHKFEMIPPSGNKTKMDADSFKRLTGHQERTNEHSRDAGMLVFGR